MTNKAIATISQELQNTDTTLLTQMPGYRRFDLRTAATPPISDMISMTAKTQYHCLTANTDRNKRPTSRS